jgi:hypothetical protein
VLIRGRGRAFFLSLSDLGWPMKVVTLVWFCMDSTILNVRIPNALAARLTEHKQKTLVPTSAFVRRAIEEALTKEESTK